MVGLRTIAACVVVLLVGPATVGASELNASQAGDSVRSACGQPFARTELFFGSAKPDGSAITDDEFGQFLTEEITPRFPDGLTLLVGSGQFRNGGGAIVRERSFILILLHARPNPTSSANVEAIRQAYKARFAQDSVLRVDTEATRVCF